MDVAATERYAVHPSVICRELGGETVPLNLVCGIYYGLDAVGTRVWQLLIEGRTIAGVCEAMLEEYDVAPDVLNDDVVRLVGELRERGCGCPRCVRRPRVSTSPPFRGNCLRDSALSSDVPATEPGAVRPARPL